MVRELQPQILINNRSGVPEDFGTPEQAVGGGEPERPWESCFTMNDHWGYSPQDHNWKSAKQIHHLLLDCVSGGGNLLLHVGPRPDGTFKCKACPLILTL
jgi:alpha-L-fucosidase